MPVGCAVVEDGPQDIPPTRCNADDEDHSNITTVKGSM